MAGPLVLKIRFNDPNSNFSGNVGAKNAAHINYIATRPGVEKCEAQIEDKNYSPEQSDNSKYVQYMDKRPRSHGLFGQNTENLDSVKNELYNHNGIVWRMIISLKEEDAIKFGYTNRQSWENTLRSSFPEAAKAMGIRENNLRWVAAFHAEGGHPHVHLVCWEKKPERPVGLLGRGETKEIKRILLKEIYAEERTKLLTEKTAMRDLLRSMAKDSISKEIDIIKSVNNMKLEVEALDGKEAGIAPKLFSEREQELADKIFKLSQLMPGKGRTALAYMPKEVKNLVRETADYILNTPHFKNNLNDYLEASKNIAKHYSSKDSSLDDAINKAYVDVRDRICQTVLSSAKELQQLINNSDNKYTNSIDDKILESANQDDIAIVEEDVNENGIKEDIKISHTDTDISSPEKKTIVSEVVNSEPSDLLERLNGSVFKYLEREVFKLDSSYIGNEELILSNSLNDEIIKDMHEIVDDIVELRMRPSMVFLNEDIQNKVYSYSQKLTNEDNIKDLYIKIEASNFDIKQVQLKVANIYLKYASELIERDKLDIEMLLHNDRASNALDKMKEASSKCIDGRKEDQGFTIKTMYRAYLYLGLSDSEASIKTIEWGNKAGIIDTDKYIHSEKKRLEYFEQKNPNVHIDFIGNKQWDRFRDCLGYEEEQFLKPWIGVLRNTKAIVDISKETTTSNDIKIELINDKVLPLIESCSNAVNDNLPKEEVAWTLKSLNNVLYSLNIQDEQRKDIVRGFFEKSNIQIPEQQYKDLFDKTDLVGNKDYWMGHEKWTRLTKNLNISDEKPWITDDLIYRLHKSVFKCIEREVLKIDNTFNKLEMSRFDDSIYSTIKDNMNEIARDISGLNTRASMVFLGDDLQSKLKTFTNSMISFDSEISTMSNLLSSLSNNNIDKINLKVADIYLKHAGELIERDKLEIEMKLHGERVINALEKMKEASNCYLNNRKEDQEFTIKTMYKAYLYLGLSDQEASLQTVEWSTKAGIENTEDYINSEKERLDNIKTKYPDENRSFVGTKDWDRFRDNLGYEEEQFLKPWIAIIKKPEIQNNVVGSPLSSNIKVELLEDKVIPVIESFKSSINNSLPKEEIAWTLKSINNVLYSLNTEDELRKDIVRGFFEKSNIQIPEQQYKDLFDKTDLSGNKDYWMGQEKWTRLTKNLNIQVDKPWLIDDLVNRLHKSVFSQLERELSNATINYNRIEISSLENDVCNEIKNDMSEIAAKVTELKMRPSMVFLDKEIQDQVSMFTKTLINNSELNVMLKNLSTDKSIDMDKLTTKICDIYLKHASELIERDKLEIEMKLHSDRAINALEKMKEASSIYIDGRKEEQEVTIKTMYKAYLYLGLSDQEASNQTSEWGTKAGIENVENYINSEKERLENLKIRYPDEDRSFIGTKEWDRFRDNLGYNEEQFLKPWIGIVDKGSFQLNKTISEQDKTFENIKVELIKDKVFSVVEVFSKARNVTLPKDEVAWTLKTINKVLYSMELENNQRENIVRRFFERSNIQIPEQQYKDLFDKTDISGNKDYWMGREKWEKLLNNLKVEVESPWKITGERNLLMKFAKDVWKSSWKLLEKERTKAQAKANIENMKVLYQQQQKVRGIQIEPDIEDR